MAVVNFSPIEKTSAGISGGTAIFGALSTSEVALWVGIIATVLTFVASQVWNYLRYRLEVKRQEYEMGMRADRRTEPGAVSKERRK